MSSKSYVSLLKRVCSEYNLPHVIDPTALAVLAELVARVPTAMGASERSWGDW